MNVSDNNNQNDESKSNAADQLIDSLLQNVAEHPKGGDDEAFLQMMEAQLDEIPANERPPEKAVRLFPILGGIAAAVAVGITTWLVTDRDNAVSPEEQSVVAVSDPTGEPPFPETQQHIARQQERVRQADEAALQAGQMMADEDYQRAIKQHRAASDLRHDAKITEERRAANAHQYEGSPEEHSVVAVSAPAGDPAFPATQQHITRQQERVRQADDTALRAAQMMADEDYQGAIEQYRAALDLLPDAKITEARRAAYTKQYANASVRLAEQRAEEGEYAQATQLVQNVLQPNTAPDNFEAKRLLEQLQDPGYYSPALTPAHLEKVRRVKYALKVAQAHLDLGDYDGAERRYNEALTQDPYNMAARRGFEANEQERLEYFEVARNQTRATFMKKIAEGWEMPVPGDANLSEAPSPGANVASDGGSISATGGGVEIGIRNDQSGGTVTLAGKASVVGDSSSLAENRSSSLVATNPVPAATAKPAEMTSGSLAQISPDAAPGVSVQPQSTTAPLTGPAPATAMPLAAADAADFEYRQRFESPAGMEATAPARGVQTHRKIVVSPQPTAKHVNGIPVNREAEEADPVEITFGRTVRPAGGAHPAEARRFAELIDNPWKSPLGEPLSTFSIDVDTASWSNVRGMLERGMSLNQIPKDSIRIEEMINYFDWKYPQPDGEHPFGFAVESAVCPWNADTQLLRVGIQGKEIQRDKRPAANLVFLLDVSGSMDQPNKLPLVKKAISVLVEELNGNDCVSVVVYAGAEGVALYPTKGNEQAEILSALDHLKAGGSTNGGAGINLAYKMAAQNFIKDGTNRVILCTDGDFNVGLTGTESLTQLVERKAKQDRVFLSVCGFGNDNLNDAMLESITNKGNGTYYFIDSFAEARKVFLRDMMATLVTIAKDVKIQVEFNPGQVKAYRLIGYANRRLAAEDFEDDRVDAGEIGAGHTVTAFYEIVPANSEMNPLREMTSNLRYQEEVAPEPAPKPKMKIVKSPELALLKLRYKEPDGDVSKLVEQTVMPNDQDWRKASRDYRFGSAVALFGLKLRQHESARSVELPEIIGIAEEAIGADPHGYRAEFVKLLKAAR